jgi:hypothetical protein
MEREVLFQEPMVYLSIHSYLSESPVKELSHKMGNIYGHCSQISMYMEGLHTMGCSLVPQGDHVQYCY